MRTKAGTSKAAATDRKRLFVEAYVANGGNATTAAKTAGYSAKTAYSSGGRLLKDVEVDAAIKARRAEVLSEAQRTSQLTANEVLEDMAQAKRFDPRKMCRPDGSMLTLAELPDEIALQLEALDYEEVYAGTGEEKKLIGRIAKVRFPKKSVVRDQAMKHFGLYELDNEQKPPFVQNNVYTPDEAYKRMLGLEPRRARKRDR